MRSDYSNPYLSNVDMKAKTAYSEQWNQVQLNVAKNTEDVY